MFVVLDHVFKFLSEEDELVLICDVPSIIIWLERLIKLIEGGDLTDELLRGSEKLLLRSVLEQTFLVNVELAVGRLASVLNEVKEGVQMIDLVNDLVGAVDPERCQ